MQTQFTNDYSIHHLVQLLEDRPAGVDTEFDQFYEDLEFEFASRRLSLANSNA